VLSVLMLKVLYIIYTTSFFVEIVCCKVSRPRLIMCCCHQRHIGVVVPHEATYCSNVFIGRLSNENISRILPRGLAGLQIAESAATTQK
jgi:hypothetical protein